MKKNINLAMVFTAMFLMVFLMMLAGCGGDGGGSPAVAPPPPVACVESSWSPEVSTEREGKHFTQTSNCETTRDAVGTWKPWVERAQFGDSVATLFKSFSDIIDIVAAPDATGGSVILGRNNNAKNNKGILLRLDAAVNELWRVQINVPLGNTFITHAITSNGNCIVPTYERWPLHERLVYAYDMAGNGGLIAETNMGYWLTSSSVLIDGNNLVMGRIEPLIAPPDPFPFSTTLLFNASMVSSDAPISKAPAINPEFETVDAAGITIVGQGRYMKYARDFTVLQASVVWSSGINPVIHDVKTANNETYIAGAVDDKMVVTKIGNPAFRNTANIPVGADKIQLYVDANGNIFVTIGNRAGRLDKLTGEISTLDPPAIPANVPGYISGTNMYFVINGNTLHVLPLDQIP